MKYLPCPFCGGQPTWKSKSMSYGTGASGMEPPMRALGCDNSTCMINPTTHWRDTGEWEQRRGHYKVNYDKVAIANWSSRAEAAE